MEKRTKSLFELGLTDLTTQQSMELPQGYHTPLSFQEGFFPWSDKQTSLPAAYLGVWHGVLTFRGFSFIHKTVFKMLKRKN